ncbi:unnamed protein product [Adineta steineri]|uniref:G-protein coupled receptors family 1 profile domain-containing protein n=3 Tax=Adineta steineri TaxID=433720 RepID=A0A813TCZ4_9BILA|nr:unnamed protein product [Adineta steineri]CAF0836782.1 unnamed protein product [Adineta steineri]CAF4072831.1 unnamed protein product [Adineta steineri]
MSDAVYFQFTRYSQPILVIFGTIGAVLNQALFYYRKPLRMSSCSLYFRMLSLNDLLVIYITILPLWLASQFNINPSTSYDWYCRLKTYLTDSLYTFSPYLVVLACLDRLCTSSTNNRLRKIATIRIASYLIPCTAAFIFAAYSHIFAGYKRGVVANISYCASFDASYSKFIGLYILFFLCIIPPILMVILCSITLILLRRQRRRIMPVNQARLRQRDNQLLKMLFMYVALNVICNVPFAVTYVLLTFEQPKYVALHVSLFRLFSLLINVNFSTSFYVYTLGTPFYRHELYNFIMVIKNKIQQTSGVYAQKRETHGSVRT